MIKFFIIVIIMSIGNYNNCVVFFVCCFSSGYFFNGLINILIKWIIIICWNCNVIINGWYIRKFFDKVIVYFMGGFYVIGKWFNDFFIFV